MKETHLYRESIKVGVSFVDDEIVWVNDEVFSGLYTIDKSTFTVKNILTPFQLFKYGKFKVRFLAKWKDNIIIIPLELNKKWLIYNIERNETQYLDVIGEKWRASGFYIIEEDMILIPASVQMPVIIVNLETMHNVQVIKNWNKDIGNNSTVFESWGGAVVNKEIFFPLYNTKYLIKISGKEIDKYIIDIPCGICGLDSYADEIWILPTDGNRIYELNPQGKIIDIAELIIDCNPVQVSDFAKIVVTKRYIFMLPFTGSKVCVYDKGGRGTVAIEGEEKSLNQIFPMHNLTPSYWECYIEKNKIYFMPLMNRMLIIDLENLKWEIKDIFLPEIILDCDLNDWYWLIQLLDEAVIKEDSGKNSLYTYLKLTKLIDRVHQSEKDGNGRKIWNSLIYESEAG